MADAIPPPTPWRLMAAWRGWEIHRSNESRGFPNPAISAGFFCMSTYRKDPRMRGYQSCTRCDFVREKPTKGVRDPRVHVLPEVVGTDKCQVFRDLAEYQAYRKERGHVGIAGTP